MSFCRTYTGSEIFSVFFPETPTWHDVSHYFLPVLGSWGPAKASLRPHCGLVVSGICPLRDALRAGECSLTTFFWFVLHSPEATSSEKLTRCRVWFLLATAPVLQSQHGWDVQQHPAQGAGAQAQRVERRPGAAGGAPAEGPHQEAGREGRLRKWRAHKT